MIIILMACKWNEANRRYKIDEGSKSHLAEFHEEFPRVICVISLAQYAEYFSHRLGVD